MTTKRFSWLAAFVCCGLLISAEPAGVFEKSSDVGTVLNAGSVEYDAAKKTYTVAGSGENMWAAADAFQYVWKRASGDVTLSADISFIGTGGNAHRKAVLIGGRRGRATPPGRRIQAHRVQGTVLRRNRRLRARSQGCGESRLLER